jgi:starch synthase (maltosyl-transferring)
VLVVVNLSGTATAETMVHLDLDALDLAHDAPIEAVDELTGESYQWHGSSNYVLLEPAVRAAHVLSLRQI